MQRPELPRTVESERMVAALVPALRTPPKCISCAEPSKALCNLPGKQGGLK